jgi:hypothetical protein
MFQENAELAHKVAALEKKYNARDVWQSALDGLVANACPGGARLAAALGWHTVVANVSLTS